MLFANINIIVSLVIVLSSLERTVAQIDFFKNTAKNPQLATSYSCSQDGISYILSKKVQKVELWIRPLAMGRRRRDATGAALGHLAGSQQVGPVPVFGFNHVGIVATTTDGYRYLVHKGGTYSRDDSWRTVVSCTLDGDTSNWSKQWGQWSPKTVSGNNNLSDYIAAGGKRYDLLNDNCQDGAIRMYNLY